MPAKTVARLAEAINRGDLDAALALYEKDAVMVVQPGQLARGAAEVRNALAGFIGLKPTLRMETEQVVETGDVALYLGRWSLRGTDPSGQPVTMSGESSDILRRQKDGRWLIALDNPWGAQILPK
ncbi:MAG TPA: SgcJ/EcaC family oxidoreductase [Burkholderiales bacterium]|nr:SgcJ/EcaC family oxidoreductase [Burkholderiales bacterium]